VSSTPIVLVPGFWLGAWAWDEVVALLRAEGHEVSALTLPGLESGEVDRAKITMQDHVDAIVNVIDAAARPVALVVHSGASVPGFGASDRVPEKIAAMVYVDTAPSNGAINPDFAGVEWALPSWEELTADPGNSLEGISPEQLDEFRQRAVPEPAAALREAPQLRNDARLEIASTIICTATRSDAYKEWAKKGYLVEPRNLSYLDLPTGHWPMWSRPRELVQIIADAAKDQPASVRPSSVGQRR
jgi:pimeloyl-ACP methyl ester carboxylesterase